MAKGKKTGGRKKGARNKRTERIDQMVNAGKQTPLEYMLATMRNEMIDPERRDEMAKAAASYVHARRAPEDKNGKTVPTIIYNMPNLEADDE